MGDNVAQKKVYNINKENSWKTSIQTNYTSR